MDQQLLLRIFPDMEYDEMVNIMNLTKDMTEVQQQSFLSMYQGKRKDRQTLLILALFGLIGFAGIHRFVIGDIGMGILYFFTGGLCFVGTIIDLVNIKKIANDYNLKMAYESANMATAFK